MKKILLSSTALVAAGVIAGSAANAEDQPIAVSVGGYYNAAMGVVDQDNGTGELAEDFNSVAFGQDIEIRVNGRATFDNGLTAGFVANIEGNNTREQSESLDERFVFFRGNFGQFRLGATESARQEFTNFAPGGAGIFGVNTPFFIFGDPGNNAISGSNVLTGPIFNVRTYDDGLGAEDSLKLVYFSPSFNGFDFALSYGPGDNRIGQYGGNARQVPGQLLDHMSAALRFAHDFGDFGVSVMGGYEKYTLDRCGPFVNSQNCTNDPESWQFGGTLSFGKVSVGGGYLISDQVGNANPQGGSSIGSSREREDFDVGIAYWDAMWGVGLQYGQANIDSTTPGSEWEFSQIALNGTYILGPGVSIQAQLDFGEFTNDDPAGIYPGAGLDNDFVEFMLGTSMSF